MVAGRAAWGDVGGDPIVIPFPDKKYQVIYADPPWSYNDKMAGHSFSLDHEYETQDIEWIKSLPASNLAARDCALFMWAVSPQIPEALDVIQSWGFKYKTVAFVWSKKTSENKDVHNLGRWTMGNIEQCFLATKGHPKRICNNVKQLVIDTRTIHSKKPAQVRSRIVDLMGDLPRIELFSRDKIEGWDCWGNQIPDSEQRLLRMDPEQQEQTVR